MVRRVQPLHDIHIIIENQDCGYRAASWHNGVILIYGTCSISFVWSPLKANENEV